MNDSNQPASGDASQIGAGLASGGQGIAVAYGGQLIPIGSRPFEIGRSPSSDLVLDHASISRHHARIVRARDGYEVQDLDSRNGVCVDAHRVCGSAPIFPGTVLRFGDVSVEVRNARRAPAELRTTRRDQPWSIRPANEEEKAQIDSVLIFVSAVDEALLKGDARRAEQIFAGHLAHPAERAAQRASLDPGVAQTVALLALRLGEATSSDAWLDFVVRLYSESGIVISLAVVCAVQSLAQKLGGVDREALSQYTAHLADRAHELTHEERLVLERLMMLTSARISDHTGKRATG